MDIEYAFWKFLWLGNLIRHGIFGGFVGSLGIFWGVDFCPLSLEIRGVTRNLSSMHSICTSTILILLVRSPPPTKFCVSIPSISLEAIAIPRTNEKQRLCNFYFIFFWAGGGGGGGGGANEVFYGRCAYGDI